MTSNDTSMATSSWTSSDASAQKSESSDVDISALTDAIWLYCSPCVFLFGMIGNVLTIGVMSRRRYSGSSVRVYMLLLAIFDSTVLLCAVPSEWLAKLDYVNIKHLHPAVCKLERLIYYVAGDASIWILCAFTVDRFVAVCFPLMRRRPGSKLGSLSAASCPIIIVLALGKNIHLMWTRGIEYDESGNVTELCGHITAYAYFENYVRPWLAFVFVSVIPFFTLFICNLMIVRALVISERIRRGSINNRHDRSKQPGAGSGVKMRAHGSHSDGGFTQTSAMCLSVSFAFLVCMVPSIILYIGRPYWTSRLYPNHAYELAKVINRLLVCFNHSINFWLYCLTGHNFRRELHAMLLCRSRRELDVKSFLAYGELSAIHGGAGGNQQQLSMVRLTVNGASPRPNSRCISRSPSVSYVRPSPTLSARGVGWGAGGRGVRGMGDRASSPWLNTKLMDRSPSSFSIRTNRSSDEGLEALCKNANDREETGTPQNSDTHLNVLPTNISEIKVPQQDNTEAVAETNCISNPITDITAHITNVAVGLSTTEAPVVQSVAARSALQCSITTNTKSQLSVPAIFQENLSNHARDV